MDTVKAPSKEGDLTNRILNRTLYARLNRTVPYPYRINRIVGFMVAKRVRNDGPRRCTHGQGRPARPLALRPYRPIAQRIGKLLIYTNHLC